MSVSQRLGLRRTSGRMLTSLLPPSLPSLLASFFLLPFLLFLSTLPTSLLPCPSPFLQFFKSVACVNTVSLYLK